MNLSMIPELLCLVVCGVAVVTDVRAFIIPNWLTAGGLVLGLVANTAIFAFATTGEGVVVGLVSSLAGALFLGVAFGMMGAMRLVAAGDVKLLIAVGALVRFPLALWVLAYVGIAGGILGLLYALIRGRFRHVVGNLVALSRFWRKREQPLSLHRVPYAVAVFCGVLWAVLGRHIPALSIT